MCVATRDLPRCLAPATDKRDGVPPHIARASTDDLPLPKTNMHDFLTCPRHPTRPQVLEAERRARSSELAAVNQDAASEMEKMLAAEKEKRVEHLKQVAIRRIALKDLARGWVGWHGMWSEKVRQRNLLKKAGARLTKPKLVACYGKWRQSWHHEQMANFGKSDKQLLVEMGEKNSALESELYEVRDTRAAATALSAL
jgi:hypothetical protein